MNKAVPGTTRVWVEGGLVWLKHDATDGQNFHYSFTWDAAKRLGEQFLDAATEAYLQQQRESGFLVVRELEIDVEGVDP